MIGAGGTPAGLGAGDTLRLEAALPLHGHELGPGITPLDAGLGWVVSWDKGEFRGRKALDRKRLLGPDRLLKGLSVDGRRPPRAEQAVLENGVTVGTVTSGNFSPTLGHGIALAFVDRRIDVGERVAVDARRALLPARIVELPFVRR